jgi:hypothetical protein
MNMKLWVTLGHHDFSVGDSVCFYQIGGNTDVYLTVEIMKPATWLAKRAPRVVKEGANPVIGYPTTLPVIEQSRPSMSFDQRKYNLNESQHDAVSMALTDGRHVINLWKRNCDLNETLCVTFSIITRIRA